MQGHNKIVKAVAKVRARRALNLKLLRPRGSERIPRTRYWGSRPKIRAQDSIGPEI